MPSLLYVSLQEEDKIALLEIDQASGRLRPEAEFAVPGGPAPQAVDPSGRFFYTGRRGVRLLSSFAIDPKSGHLAQIGEIPLFSDPCWLATDRSGRFLLSAYYEGGGISVHGIGPDGAAQEQPIERLNTATGAHCFQTDPTNRYAFASHIAGERGPNAIFQFRFDASTGRVTPNDPPVLHPDRPVGPRHFAFHPAKDVVYFSNEQGGSVTAYNLDAVKGTLSALQTVPTLPAEFSGRNSCSKCKITPDGRFVYVPNRGHNSIACFTTDQAAGRITSLGQQPTEPMPRAIGIDPTGNYLYAAGLDSGRLSAYRIQEDGRLRLIESYPVGKRPMWVMSITTQGV